MRPYFICPAPQCRFLRMGMGSLYMFLATWQQGGIKMATIRPSCSCVCQATHNDIHIHLPNKWQVCQQLRAANMCLCWKGTLPSEECPDCLGLCSQVLCWTPLNLYICMHIYIYIYIYILICWWYGQETFYLSTVKTEWHQVLHCLYNRMFCSKTVVQAHLRLA